MDGSEWGAVIASTQRYHTVAFTWDPGAVMEPSTAGDSSKEAERKVRVPVAGEME